MANRRGKAGGAGNPDGSPRLELAEASAVAEVEGDAEIIAAIKAVEAEDAREVEAEDAFSEEARTEASDFSTVLTEEAEPTSGDRPSYYSKKRAKEQAKETATWLLLILEGAAVVAFGEDARMPAATRKMISEPLQRMMARMDPAINEALQKWTDPILLLFGLATWGLQLYAITKDREDDDGSGPPSKEPPSGIVPPGNGRERSVEPAGFDDADISLLRAGPPPELVKQFDGEQWG